MTIEVDEIQLFPWSLIISSQYPIKSMYAIYYMWPYNFLPSTSSWFCIKIKWKWGTIFISLKKWNLDQIWNQYATHIKILNRFCYIELIHSWDNDGRSSQKKEKDEKDYVDKTPLKPPLQSMNWEIAPAKQETTTKSILETNLYFAVPTLTALLLY